MFNVDETIGQTMPRANKEARTNNSLFGIRSILPTPQRQHKTGRRCARIHNCTAYANAGMRVV
ncbi:hypothetical protein AB4Y32_26180 [Paraburkholderia phymatum]|uniref:Uncharacterized protein n=1 Tax=Paraburkholderia phymatum TaxID=148447 RepID=A0ACC6U6Z2_9BURK